MARPDEPAGTPRWSQLMSRCASVLDDLDVLDDAEPFDLEVFCNRLARRRGRRILMTPIRLPALRRPDAGHGASEETLCGMYISTERADHVYYTETLSALHAAHNAVHELSHLILKHRSVLPLARPSLGRMWAGSAESVQDWLAGLSSSYSETDEIEAEAMAAVVLSERVRDGVPRRWISSSMMRVGSERLADAWW